jgi:hypothetical protein
VSRGKGVDDEVRGVTASSKTWSALSITSRGRRGRRLETIRMSAARVVDDSVDVLPIRTNRKRHDMRQRERKSLGQRGARGLTVGRWI